MPHQVTATVRRRGKPVGLNMEYTVALFPRQPHLPYPVVYIWTFHPYINLHFKRFSSLVLHHNGLHRCAPGLTGSNTASHNFTAKLLFIILSQSLSVRKAERLMKWSSKSTTLSFHESSSWLTHTHTHRGLMTIALGRDVMRVHTSPTRLPHLSPCYQLLFVVFNLSSELPYISKHVKLLWKQILFFHSSSKVIQSYMVPVAVINGTLTFISSLITIITEYFLKEDFFKIK